MTALLQPQLLFEALQSHGQPFLLDPKPAEMRGGRSWRRVTAEKQFQQQLVAGRLRFCGLRQPHPKLLAAVMVDEPKGEIYGGQVAAPAWKQIMNFALQYLKISP